MHPHLLAVARALRPDVARMLRTELRRTRSSLPLLPALVAGVLPAFTGGEPPRPNEPTSTGRSTLELEQLHYRDVAYACRLQGVLSRRRLTTEALIDELDLAITSATPYPELGAGATRLRLESQAGTGHCQVDTLVLEGIRSRQVFRVHVLFGFARSEVQDASGQSAAEHFREEVRGTWTIPFDESQRGFELRWRDKLLAHQQEAHLSGVGIGSGARDIPEELRWIYGYLSSPFTRDIVFFCGDAASEQLSYVASMIDALVALERWDILRRLLRCLNPTTRTYAAKALQDSNQLEPPDEEVLRLVRTTGTLIPFTTDGNGVNFTTAAMLLDPPATIPRSPVRTRRRAGLTRPEDK